MGAEDYGPIRDAEVPEMVQMLTWAYTSALSDIDTWIAKAGRDNFRVLRSGGRLSACLLFIPMGQFFGGHSVPTVGVAGVATPPDLRGSGASIALMEHAIRELAARKVPLSSLYPATRSLYRRVGYEPAGSRLEVSASVRALVAKPDRTLPLRPMTDADKDAVVAAYRTVASRNPGHLDRGAYVWERIHNPRGEAARGFVVGDRGRVEGYVILYEKRAPTHLYDLHVNDLVALTPSAHRRLLTFLADHGTLAGSVVWHGAPNDTFVQLLPDRYYEVRRLEHWMLRVVDVPAALAARGYPPQLRGQIELDVVDPLVAENTGRFVLRVEGGEGHVQRGGAGTLRLDVRGLAPLYSGLVSPKALAAVGLVEGAADVLAEAGALFASPPPWMPDFF